MTDRCAVPRCRGDVEIVYLDHGVRSDHWTELTAEDQPADALARALGLSVAEATTKETDMSEKNETTKKATKNTVKAAKATKAVKEPKPKKERAEKPGNRVFAIRVTDAELAAIHKAAGPRNATRLVRALTAAFVAGDDAAFKAIVKEAREARG